MSLERRRPADRQVGQGAVSDAGSDYSTTEVSRGLDPRKVLENLRVGIEQMERMTRDWPAEQRARVLDYLHEQQKVERARLRSQHAAPIPRPVARHRERRITASPAVQSAHTTTACALLDDGGGRENGDDDSEPAQGQERAA